jgi:hypothetical protein
MKIEVSNGEIVDKFTILKIKLEKIIDEEKLKYVQKEHAYLGKQVLQIGVEDIYINKLYDINCILWDIEDSIRLKEQKSEFDATFIQLARKVYITNDKRAAIKKEINIVTKSKFHEVKQLPNVQII